MAGLGRLPLAASLMPGEHDYLKPQTGGFLGRVSTMLFPNVPGMAPGAADAARKAAMLRLGLGLAARGSEGQSTGQALLGSYLGATNQYQNAAANAYQSATLRREQERQDERDKRERAQFEAEQRADAAGAINRVLTPESTPQSLVSGPMREYLEQIGYLQPAQAAIATPDPADDAALLQELRQYGTAYGDPMAGTTAELATFDQMTEGLTPEQRRQAREVALGIRSRAGTNRVTDVAGVPTLTGTTADGRPFSIPLTTPGAERSGATGMSAANTLGKVAIERFDKQYEDALSAASSLRAIEQGARLLDEGIRTGTAAGGRNLIARAFDTVLGRQTDEAAVTANTDAYLANAGQLVAERIKAFGAGTGLSDADRAFAERMAGGDVSMTEGALRRILEINYKAARGKIERYNSRYDSLSGTYGDVAAIYDRFDVPTFEEIAPWAQAAPSEIPAGVDPADWQFMTPEERALWR